MQFAWNIGFSIINLACFQHHVHTWSNFLQGFEMRSFWGIFSKRKKSAWNWTKISFRSQSQAGSPKRRLAWFFWMVNIPGTTRSWEKIGALKGGIGLAFDAMIRIQWDKKNRYQKHQKKQVPISLAFFTRFRQHALMFDSTFADWISFHVVARWIGRGRVTY